MNSKTLEINIPTDLSEITLRQYLLIQKHIETGIDVELNLISILCDLSIDEIRSIKHNEFTDIVNILNDLLNKKSIFIDKFKINNIEYGFIPNIDDMTFGEYIDLDTYIKNPEDIHKVMTILFRPIKINSFGRYTIEDYTGKEDVNIMLDAPMNAVNGAMIFFYHLGNELLKAIPKFLKSEMKKGLLSKEISEKDGDGIVQSMQLLTENLQILMMQQNTEYIKY